VATLIGYTLGLFYGFSIRAIYSELLYSSFCLYIWPVARQVDYHQATQAIQSNLCCAYITTIVIFITKHKALTCRRTRQIFRLHYSSKATSYSTVKSILIVLRNAIRPGFAA
jgi:hypothetical protein